MKTTQWHLRPHPAAKNWPNTPCCNRPETSFYREGFTTDPRRVTCPGDTEHARAVRRAALPKPTPEPEPKVMRERTVTCARCGNDFTTRGTGGTKYCGDECRTATIREQKKAQRLAKR